MLEVGNGLTDGEGRAHFSLWAIMAAPLIAGNDLRNMSAATRATLTNAEVIAVDQDPLGIQGRLVATPGTRGANNAAEAATRRGALGFTHVVIDWRHAKDVYFGPPEITSDCAELPREQLYRERRLLDDLLRRSSKSCLA